MGICSSSFTLSIILCFDGMDCLKNQSHSCLKPVRPFGLIPEFPGLCSIRKGRRFLDELHMSFMASDEAGCIRHRKCRRRWISTESSLVADPLNKRFNIAFGSWKESHLSLIYRQFGVGLELMVELSKSFIHACCKIVSEQVGSDAYCRTSALKRVLVVDTTRTTLPS
jgi:hypothetical protein